MIHTLFYDCILIFVAECTFDSRKTVRSKLNNFIVVSQYGSSLKPSLPYLHFLLTNPYLYVYLSVT